LMALEKQDSKLNLLASAKPSGVIGLY